MPITQEQALELADKWLLGFEGKVVLRDNMNISKSAEGWRIVAKTTPIITGMETEIMTFSINAETGEVGVSMTITVSIPDVLKEINERKNLDETKKEQLIAKVREFDTEITKKPVDRNKVGDLKTWFENNASWLKEVISIISTILSMLH